VRPSHEGEQRRRNWRQMDRAVPGPMLWPRGVAPPPRDRWRESRWRRIATVVHSESPLGGNRKLIGDGRCGGRSNRGKNKRSTRPTDTDRMRSVVAYTRGFRAPERGIEGGMGGRGDTGPERSARGAVSGHDLPTMGRARWTPRICRDRSMVAHPMGRFRRHKWGNLSPPPMRGRGRQVKVRSVRWRREERIQETGKPKEALAWC